MYARHFTALVCLLSFGPCTGRAGSLPSPDHKLVLYLRTPTTTSRPVLAMEQEVESQIKAAGYQVEWRRLGGSALGTEDGFIAIIELKGTCEAPAPGIYVTPVKTGASLASTAVENGQVLPFSWINCETMTETLAASLTTADSDRRDFLYGRAMGRVLTHELYHLLANEIEHLESGVAKSSFTAGDLLSEHFTLPIPALDRLRASTAGEIDGAPGPITTGER
jgi:hypothetical protein